MRILFVSIISLLLMASCGGETEKTNQKNTIPGGDHIISTYANGKPKLVQTFKTENGKSSAVYEKEYYEDYSILKEGGLKNGNRIGLWKSFRRDGLLWSEGYYSDGIRNGITITYHPNGQKYYSGEYTKGVKTGLWKFYNEEGKLIKEKDFSKK